MSRLLTSKCVLIITLGFISLATLPAALVADQAKPQTSPQTTSNIVTDGVMAKDVKGANFEPIDITTEFPADQKTFHAIITLANAPDSTLIKAVWLSSTNAKMGEFELKTSGSRNLDFSYILDSGKLPAGAYKVEIYVNNVLARTIDFTAAGGGTSSTASARIILDVVMAQDTTGEEKEPENPTIIFKSTDTIHAVVRTQDTPANTKFKASWYVKDVGTAAPGNTLITDTEIATDGTRNIDFTLKPSSTWPIGTYRVEISVNGVLDTVREYSVQ